MRRRSHGDEAGEVALPRTHRLETELRSRGEDGEACAGAAELWGREQGRHSNGDAAVVAGPWQQSHGRRSMMTELRIQGEDGKVCPGAAELRRRELGRHSSGEAAVVAERWRQSRGDRAEEAVSQSGRGAGAAELGRRSRDGTARAKVVAKAGTAALDG